MKWNIRTISAMFRDWIAFCAFAGFMFSVPFFQFSIFSFYICCMVRDDKNTQRRTYKWSDLLTLHRSKALTVKSYCVGRLDWPIEICLENSIRIYQMKSNRELVGFIKLTIWHQNRYIDSCPNIRRLNTVYNPFNEIDPEVEECSFCSIKIENSKMLSIFISE